MSANKDHLKNEVLMLSKSFFSGTSINQTGLNLFKPNLFIDIGLQRVSALSIVLNVLKVNNEEISEKNWRRSGVFIINFEHFQHNTQYINLMFLFIILSIYFPNGRKCFFCVKLSQAPIKY